MSAFGVSTIFTSCQPISVDVMLVAALESAATLVTFLHKWCRYPATKIAKVRIRDFSFEFFLVFRDFKVVLETQTVTKNPSGKFLEYLSR